MARVDLRGVSKSYNRHQALKDIDLEIGDREFVVFVGPSGCGKSTLLRAIAGLIEVSEGEIYIGETMVNDVAPADRGVAMVFQNYALFPHMNVYNNMAFGLRMARFPKEEIEQRVLNAARMLQIEQLLERRPRELSGGQRQRVAIGRAIVRHPKVFLFDEPLSNLDATLRVATRVEIAKLHRAVNATAIYVTHDQVEAMTLADRIVVMQNGVVEQVGTPLDVYHRPRNLFVAGFIGTPRMNLLPTTLVRADQTRATVSFTSGARIDVPCRTSGLSVGDPLTLGVRPQHLLPHDPAPLIKGSIEAVEHLGDDTFLYIDLGNAEQVVVKVNVETRAAVGEEIAVGALGAACHLFDNNGVALTRVEPERPHSTGRAGPLA